MTIDKFKYLSVADYICQGRRGATRSEIAELLGCGKSTATYHLEKAVRFGFLRKAYTWTGHGEQRGWVYFCAGCQDELLPTTAELTGADDFQGANDLPDLPF